MAPRAASLVAYFLFWGPLGAPSAAQGGKLERVREEVRSEDEDEPFDAADEDEDDEDFFDRLAGHVIALPFAAPRWLLGDDSFGPCSFAPYPYAGGGGYWLVPEPYSSAGESPAGARWSARARAELGSDLDGLTRVGGRVRVEHASRLGLDLALDRWSEDLSGAATDELRTGDALLHYRFAQSEYAAFRLGGGFSWLEDDAGTESGFALAYGAELHPVPPFVLDLEADIGRVGSATRVHGRTGLAWVFRRLELGLVLDAWSFDGADLQSVGLACGGRF
jgi:hypothetical protein